MPNVKSAYPEVQSTGGTKPHRRSQQGCWTCRLRRKKCDETKPGCLVCKDRALHCAGYGKTKPKWMDGGSRQQSIHNEIKATVAAVTRMKRMMRMAEEQRPACSSDSQDVPLEQSDDDDPDHSQSSNASGATNLTAYPISDHDIFDNITIPEGFSVKETPWDLSTNAQHKLPLASGDSFSDPWQTSSMIDHPFTTPLPLTATGTMTLAHSSPTQQTSIDLGMYPASEGSNSSTTTSVRTSPGTVQLDTTGTPLLYDTIPSSTASDYHVHAAGLNDPTTHGKHSQSRERSISAVDLVTGLRHSRPAHVREATNTTLLSFQNQLHKTLTRPEISGEPFSSGPDGDTTLSWTANTPTKSRRELGSMPANAAPSLLTKASELYEYVATLVDSKSMDTKAGIGKMVSLLDSNLVACVRDCQTYSNVPISKPDYGNSDLLKRTIRTTLWLHTISRTFELIPCASPFTGQLAHLLQVSETRSSNAGVPAESWLILILESINKLAYDQSQTVNAWKGQGYEISKRAAIIRSRIEYYLTADDYLATTESVSAVEIICRNIFLHALLIYMNVVAVGSFSEAPEIRKNVKIVIKNLQSLDNPSLVGSLLVWPFCVMACLAGPDRHRTVVQLYRDAAHASGQPVPRLTQAFKVIRECWELRAKGVHADWRTAARIIEEREVNTEVNCW